jgi:hypothetical protein
MASNKLVLLISVGLAHIGLPQSPKAHKLPADINLKKSLLVNLLTIVREHILLSVPEPTGQ